MFRDVLRRGWSERGTGSNEGGWGKRSTVRGVGGVPREVVETLEGRTTVGSVVARDHTGNNRDISPVIDITVGPY